MRHGTLRIWALLATSVLGACGDGTGVNTDLSDAEAAALAEAVVQAAMFATVNGAGPAAAEGPQAAPYAYSEEVSFTSECLLGGGVAVTGSVDVSGDDETGAGRIALAVTHEHQACVVEAENGMVFTFDGSPDLSLDLVLEADGQGELTWTGLLEGAVDWTTDERQGRCTIALDFSGFVSDLDSAIAVSVEGAVCRRAVEHSWSLDFGTT